MLMMMEIKIDAFATGVRNLPLSEKNAHSYEHNNRQPMTEYLKRLVTLEKNKDRLHDMRIISCRFNADFVDTGGPNIKINATACLIIGRLG